MESYNPLEIRNKYNLNDISLGVPVPDIKLLYRFGVCLGSANILFLFLKKSQWENFNEDVFPPENFPHVISLLQEA